MLTLSALDEVDRTALLAEIDTRLGRPLPSVDAELGIVSLVRAQSLDGAPAVRGGYVAKDSCVSDALLRLIRQQGDPSDVQFVCSPASFGDRKVSQRRAVEAVRADLTKCRATIVETRPLAGTLADVLQERVDELVGLLNLIERAVE